MLGGEGTVDASISQQLIKAVPSLPQIGSLIPEIAEKNRGWTSLVFSVFGCLHLPEKNGVICRSLRLPQDKSGMSMSLNIVRFRMAALAEKIRGCP